MTTLGDAERDRIAYERAKQMARAADVSVRQALAERQDVSPELLFFLAADTAAIVRQALAANPKTPGQADLLLSRDPDVGVRRSLLVKAAARIPPNGSELHAPLEKFTLQILTVLSEDKSRAVRALLSAALRDREHAPYAVVRALASDREIDVAEPVLTHSPQLTERDLLDVVARRPIPGALGAIARRTHVTSALADAIAHSNDVEAVAALLENRSAQIREETLDHILDKAPRHERWHRPLVERPHLPGDAVRQLATFVATSLVEVLAERDDLDEETARKVAETLRERIEAAPRVVAEGQADNEEEPPEPPSKRARRLHDADTLDETVIDEAIAAGDRGFVVSALAVRTGMPEPMVDRILRAQSARGVVALVWKAGLSMRVALKMQLQIARLSPRSILNARDGVDYPMTPEEMDWQIQFFGGAPTPPAKRRPDAADG